MTLRRHSGDSVTAFQLHREDSGAFILACSCSNEMDSVFKLHTLEDSYLRAFHEIPSSPDSAVYLGSMSLNFLGTEFVIKDHRGDVVHLAKDGQHVNELGLVVYDANVTGREPNAMRVVARSRIPLTFVVETPPRRTTVCSSDH